MTSIYESLHYRQILSLRAQELKAQRPGWTLGKLAEKALIQAPYLTNVLKERAHLNPDQLYSLSHLLGFDDDETQYAQLLLEWERSGHAGRKLRLKAQIETIRKANLSSKANLKKELVADEEKHTLRFFLNPYYKIINSFLAVERFAKEPLRIANALHISPAQLERWLKDLTEMNFIKKNLGGYQKLKKNFHLPRESPLCDPHQALISSSASQHAQSLPDDEKFNFMLTFSADDETREKIQREFMKFLKTIEEDVKAAPSKEIYGLSFDLFKWSYESQGKN